MSHFHAVLWIDHHEARILDFNEDERNEATVHPRHPVRHLHTKAGSMSSWRVKEDTEFFKDVASHLKDVGEILVCGPANAKLAFVKYLGAHEPAIADKVVGVESVDHPTDGQLVNYARSYFKGVDRMLPQID